MKIVVTIFQCKRVVLPYIFIRYALPKMCARFPGEIIVYLIQHVGGFFGSKNFLETSMMPKEKLKLVREWTEQGRYEGAKIIQHSESQPHYPHMPSMRKGVEYALEENADFHLWMDDDVIICDEECDKWVDIIGSSDVGVYNDKAEIINVGYFVSTPKFDRRMLPLMSNRKIWSIVKDNYDESGKLNPGRIEARLTLESQSRAYLNETYRARMHRNRKSNAESVRKMVKELSPQEVDLLKIDYPDIATSNIPVLIKSIEDDTPEIFYDPSIISLCTTCMNRIEYLRESLKTWVGKEFREIVIVDWSSEEPVHMQLGDFARQGIKVLRVEGKTEFLPTRARNLAVFSCLGEYVWHLDCDIKINYESGERPFELCSDRFYQGHWNVTGRSTTGTCVAKREAYEKVNGYSELIGTLAGEDFDLYERFEEAGFKSVIFQRGLLQHIDHSDDLRTKHRPWNGLTQKQGRMINRRLPRWTAEYQREEIPYKLYEI